VSLDRWIPLDLTRKPDPPNDLVPRVLTPGWITLFSGPPGAGKSYGYVSLIAAALTEGRWLGIPVDGIERVVVLDEENPRDVALQRLRAFGVNGEHTEGLRYYSQLGCRLGGDGSWSDELTEIVSEFHPQLVVIDSASSATATQINENDSISNMFSTVLRPLARLGCAVLLVHHDRKAGGTVDERVLGGMQWLGQVDRQIAFQAREARADSWTTVEGTTRASFPVRIVAGKARQGVGMSEARASIESEQSPDGSYRWIRLELDESADEDQHLDEQIVEFLFKCERQRARLGVIAGELEMSSNDGRLGRALKRLLKRRAITKPERGTYALA
jgi:hypothetical protein